MHVGRPRNSTVSYPQNYQYVLYEMIDKDKNSVIRTLPAVPSHSKLRPVRLHKLLTKYGHSKTTKFLKGFGDNWVCKEGVFFYDKKSEHHV